MDLAIRAAVQPDMAQVAAIYGHYVEHSVATFDLEPLPVAAWGRRLADVTACGLPFVVADAAGEVAGYAYAAPWRPKPAYQHTVEDSVYLNPAHLGRGTGTALLTELLARCQAASVRQVIAVIADTGSDASRALHRKLGFIQAGQLRAVGYKLGRWVDTALMQRDLTIGTSPGL